MAFIIITMISIAPVALVAIKSMQKTMALEKARADSATGLEIIDKTYPGSWGVKDGKLYKGTQVMSDNFKIVDRVAELTGDSATLFLGDTRVSTTLKKDGQRAVGTKVSPEVKAVVLEKGQKYAGQATVVGVKYYTNYIPLKDHENNVVGMFYVGVSQTLLDAVTGNFLSNIALTSLLTLVVALVMAWLFARNITTPVFKLKEVMELAGNGDFTQEAIVSTRDELRVLADSYNSMMKKVRAVFSDIRLASDQLALASDDFLVTSEKLAATNQEINRAVEDVAAGNTRQTHDISKIVTVIENLNNTINSIAAGSQQQTAGVEQASEIMDKMVGGIKNVAVSAEVAAQVGKDATLVAQKGADAVGKVVAGMENIKSKVFEVADKIKELGSESHRIGEIIQVIDDIAGQTNLLALNAAIEAARAGENGKGFAVVADEVRKLAEKSSEAAKEIEELVKNIQIGTKKAISATDQGTAEVENGAGLAIDAGQALEDILNYVSRTNNEIIQISKDIDSVSDLSSQALHLVIDVASVAKDNTVLTTNMAENSEEAKNAVIEIANVSENSAVAAEEVAASVEQTSVTSKQIADSAYTLSDMAKNLENSVNKFQI